MHRAAGDDDAAAEVLLLQARLAALAQQHDAAIDKVQATQAMGGSVELWRDSTQLYAAVQAGQPGMAAADALAALQDGVAFLGALAR